MAEKKRKKPERSSHWGDCTVYSSIINGRPYDGICTCGYGWEVKTRTGGSEAQLISGERMALERQIDRAFLTRQTKAMKHLKKLFGNS